MIVYFIIYTQAREYTSPNKKYIITKLPLVHFLMKKINKIFSSTYYAQMI